MNEVPVRPVLRYHGGKYRLREWVIRHFPDHDVYVEPFGGVASVLLAKDPARIEVYNDIDSLVVNLFRVLRNPGQAQMLIEKLELTPFGREEFHDCFEESSDPVEEARRMIVRSFQSIGTKHRSKRNGWRTPTAKSRWSPTSSWNSYPPSLQVVTNRLREVVIEHLPWQDVLSAYDEPAARFYIDPPYPHGTRTKNHSQVYSSEMTDAEHAELCARILDLRGFVILSSYQNQIYDELLKGWKLSTIAARAQTNAPRTEVLYINPRAAENVQASLFEVSA